MRYSSTLSLNDISPLSIIPGDCLLVAFKAYFDGGNEADSTQYEIVTLAGVSGDEIHWKNFESQWRAVLDKHKAKYLHTTDALALQRAFRIDHGWDNPRVEKLIEDCVSVLERCCSTQDANDYIVYPGLRPATISINLHDFKRTLVKVPDLGTPEHLCATNCAQCVLTYGIHIKHAKSFQFFFDRGEPFYGHIRDRVDHPKSRRAGPYWTLVTHLGESNMREVPALQAADLFAWSVSHYHQEGKARFDWQKRVLAIKREETYFRHARLLKPILEHIELVKKWKLPRRRAVR
jgi:hypothetical protein